MTGLAVPALAAGSGSGIGICHRTHSTTNPYRKITVGISAVNGSGTNDHSHHTGGVFDPTFAYPSNAKVWGDIIPAGNNYGLNWTTAGQAMFASSRCWALTAQQYYNSEREAGVSDADIKADLAEQGAAADSGVTLTALGYTGSDPAVTASPTPTVAPTTNPTMTPTVTPTLVPTTTPTVAATVTPTVTPTADPTATPTVDATQSPIVTPTVDVTTSSTVTATVSPTVDPTTSPTPSPTADVLTPALDLPTADPLPSPTFIVDLPPVPTVPTIVADVPAPPAAPLVTAALSPPASPDLGGTPPIPSDPSPTPIVALLPTVDAPAASVPLSTLVFLDLDADGRRDTGEPGVPGLPVELDGVVVGTTDVQGQLRTAASFGSHQVTAETSDLLAVTGSSSGTRSWTLRTTGGSAWWAVRGSSQLQAQVLTAAGALWSGDAVVTWNGADGAAGTADDLRLVVHVLRGRLLAAGLPAGGYHVSLLSGRSLGNLTLGSGSVSTTVLRPPALPHTGLPLEGLLLYALLFASAGAGLLLSGRRRT